jgi:hypothetical protein
MANYFNYPEVVIEGSTYYTYSNFNKTFYFKDWYKMGFANLGEDKLTEFATWVFQVHKSNIDVTEQFLIMTGEVK